MQARFAHTITNLNTTLICMFGGAVGDPGKYNITNDVYVYDTTKSAWRTIIAEGAPPPRAAHAACAVDNTHLVIFGGATGGGSLSEDSLFFLDLCDPNIPVWKEIKPVGPGPGSRYGHVMVYCRPNIIIFGGNTGGGALNDVWRLDLEVRPMRWQQVLFPNGALEPQPRVYHSGDVVREGGAAGMVVVHGGRTQDGVTLGDLWGLRQHRNKRWDWVQGPIRPGGLDDESLGLKRFQHSCIAHGTKIFLLGGRLTGLSYPLPAISYDTETCSWSNLSFVINRYRHAACLFPTKDDYKIIMYGGFKLTCLHPTSQIELVDPFSHTTKTLDEPGGGGVGDPNWSKNRQVSNASSLDLSVSSKGADFIEGPVQNVPVTSASSGSGRRVLNEMDRARVAPTVKLSYHVHTKVDTPYETYEVAPTKIALDRLGDESRRIRGGHPAVPTAEHDNNQYIDHIINRLLKPSMMPNKSETEFNPHLEFTLTREEITFLCKRVIALFRQEPMVLKLRSPIKVYGDVHGQYYDLMRMFKTYKSPVMDDYAEDDQFAWDQGIEGDLDSTDYLFLGDYVERGTNSLEVICLLFALKTRWPDRIHLIRGNHEDSVINSIYGFKDESRLRLKENPDHPDSCWAKINRAFEYLPMGAVIEDRILCIHGGIGGTVNSIKEIEDLQRPLNVAQVPTSKIEQRVTDLLWSDPSENDSSLGVVPTAVRAPDGSGQIVKFGPDRVVQFLQDNKLELIIRAHECVMDGIERFAGGRLIALFSATDYCGTHKNAGALLFVRRDLTIVPKIIYPQGRDASGVINSGSTWILDPARPPTPPRDIMRYQNSDLFGTNN